MIKYGLHLQKTQSLKKHLGLTWKQQAVLERRLQVGDGAALLLAGTLTQEICGGKEREGDVH